MSQLSKRILADSPRFLEDALRSIKKFSEEVDALLQLQKQFIRQTAATFSLEVDIGPAGGELKTSPHIQQTPNANLKVADMERLRKNYSIIHDLWGTREALESMAISIRQAFASRGEDTDKAVAEIAKLKLKVDKGLEEAFIFVSGLAHQNLPAKFETFNKALGLVLEKSIIFDDSKQYTYLHEVDGDLVFSTYTQLISVMDDDGTYYPELYVVSSYRIGMEQGTFIAILTKFAPPSERLLMKKVTTIKETLRALNMLLSMDNFTTSVGSLPIALLLKEGTVKRDLFLYQNLIKSIQVAENKVVLVLKPEVTDDKEAHSIINQINLDFKQATKKTGTKLSMAVKKPMKSTEKCFVLTFFFNPPNDVLWATPEDLQFIKERFQLSDLTLRTVVRTINSGSSN